MHAPRSFPSRPRWPAAAWCVVLGLLPAACATPYKKAGTMGGVEEVQITQEVFRITARGNGYTSRERVEDFALLRASELALMHGYPGFQLADVRDSTRIMEWTSKPSLTATRNASGSTVTYNPPETTTIRKPGVTIYVKMVTDGPGLDARLINRRLAKRYGVPRSSDEGVPPASPQMTATVQLDPERVRAERVQNEAQAMKSALETCMKSYQDPRLDPIRGVVGGLGEPAITLPMRSDPSHVTEDQKPALALYDQLRQACRTNVSAASPTMAKTLAEVGTGDEELTRLYSGELTIGEYNQALRRRQEKLRAALQTAR